MGEKPAGVPVDVRFYYAPLSDSSKFLVVRARLVRLTATLAILDIPAHRKAEPWYSPLSARENTEPHQRKFWRVGTRWDDHRIGWQHERASFSTHYVIDAAALHTAIATFEAQP